MPVILSSTTDTPEQVKAAIEATGHAAETVETTPGAPPAAETQAAAQETPKPKETEKPPETPEPPAEPPAGEAGDESAGAAGATEEHQEPEAEKPKDGKPSGKPRKGIQERISELTAARKDAERRANEANERAERAERQLAEKNKRPAETRTAEATPPAVDTASAADDTSDPEPMADGPEFDGKPYEDWVRAHSEWAARKAVRDYEAKQAKAREAELARQPAVDAWNTSLQEAKGRHEDFDLALDESERAKVEITGAMNAAIFESPLGGELLYYLAKNPAEVERIKALPQASQVRELGRIEGKLAAELETPAKPPAEKPPEKAPEKPKPTPAPLPKPIAPVGASAAPSAPDPSKMSGAEWRKWRESQGRR